MKKLEEPRNAAIYARQSLSHAEGIDRQVALCRKLCKERGWEVVRVFEDNDVSAFKERKATSSWGRMLADIPSGEFDVVVAVDLDRLLRKVSDLTLLTDQGIRVLTVNGEIDLTSADGQFRANMLASIAQFETKRKSERQIRANEAKVASGRPVPSRRRYGYESDGCTPRESEAKEVKRIFEKFIEGASIRSLAIDMQERMVDPGGGKNWSVRRVRDMLANCTYGGQIAHLGVVFESDAITPIVSKELASQVRAILADPSRKTSPGATIRHELSGLAECGVCGAKLHYMVDYMCGKATNHVSIKKYKIEPLVMWRVFEWIKADDRTTAPSKNSGIIGKLLSESAELAEKIIQVQEMVEWPGSDKATLKARIASLGREREAVESKIGLEKSKTAIGEVAYRVRAEWQKPVDAHSFEGWRIAMKKSAELLGTEIDESDVTFEIFQQKTRIERELDGWPHFWTSLPLDTRREVIGSLFQIKVLKGSSPDRVEITPVDQPL